MGRRRRRFSGGREAGEEDFELNLASIIDCFMVVITYLLFTAAFISLAEMDVSAVTLGDSNSATSMPSETLSVAMGPHKALSIQAKGQENISYDLPMRNGDWDVDALQSKLAQLKSKFPSVDALVLAAGDGVHYEEVVKILESTQKVYPKVGLADLNDESAANGPASSGGAAL